MTKVQLHKRVKICFEHQRNRSSQADQINLCYSITSLHSVHCKLHLVKSIFRFRNFNESPFSGEIKVGLNLLGRIWYVMVECNRRRINHNHEDGGLAHIAASPTYTETNTHIKRLKMKTNQHLQIECISRSRSPSKKDTAILSSF